MSKKSIVLDKKCLFPTRFMKLCSTEDKPLESWGEIFDVSRQTVSNWQTGKSVPDIIKLTEIARYFEVSADYLLGISDTESPDVNVRAAAEYTGLSEDAVERLHIGMDDFKCAGVGISGTDRAKNMRIASELICSAEFTQMIYRLRCVEDDAYDEELLKILEAEHSEAALTNADEFVFAKPEDRAVALKAIAYMFAAHGDKAECAAIAEELNEMSDDELLSVIISGLLSKRDSKELHQYHAAKAFNSFVDGLIKDKAESAKQLIQSIIGKN